MHSSHVFGLAVALCLAAAGPVRASHDPHRTATIYVLGYDPDASTGIYGGDLHDALADSIAALVGMPTVTDSVGPLPADVIAGTSYYGDVPPFYYSPADVDQVNAITQQWGGGVPRYALIVAKYARRILERSGADQVNFVSLSFGSLIVRWLIEKDVEGLASQGLIARWLSDEGVVAGNWAASQPDLINIVDVIKPQPIDVEHMSYGWIQSHLHWPRTEAADPNYGRILIGEVGSTDDRGNNAALRDAMLAYGEYQPNDSVQGLYDARFSTITDAARFDGLPPTQAVFHADHLGIKQWRSAWAEAAIFLTASRRVTVTMTSARVTNLHEPQLPYWNWLPAEVLFESRAYSPAAEARWGITQPLSAYVKEGASPPLRRYRTTGETQSFQYVLFDDLVLPEETALRFDLNGVEVDYDPRYGVFETAQTPYYDDMGGGSLTVSALQSGTYDFAARDWSCQLEVDVHDYAFPSVVGVGSPNVEHPRTVLTISPNPFASMVRIVAPAIAGAPGERAVLEIADIEGRRVRRLEGAVGQPFLWNGRGDDGHQLPAGVYVHRLVTARGVWFGRSCLLR